ncbi:MAG TPA: plastocyanin/azurin family copper-binding protein [Terriglobales bacterium]|nr:plastocyanin/azurin family copper-binding protein [Terriglobales bacterium]
MTFEAPMEPGEYTFVCSFPGHFALGMKGQLIVK